MAENTDNALTYWILVDNNEVLACSLVVRPVANGEINKQASVVNDQETNWRLDLLSDYMAKHNPNEDVMVDITSVNGAATPSNNFDPNQHIGLQFVHTDKNNVPTRTKVVEVNEDTRKLMIKYIHGGLEMVDLNIIQEALLSKEQLEGGDALWVFDKILNYRTIDHDRVEVEVLWDNGETSWEP